AAARAHERRAVPRGRPRAGARRGRACLSGRRAGRGRGGVTLALVRHGRTEWNRQRRMQGRADVPLDDHGRAQADAVGQLLSRAVWSVVVSSPLQRAAETARIIGARLGVVEPVTDPRLIERDYGVAEGLPVAEAHERWPDHGYPAAEP